MWGDLGKLIVAKVQQIAQSGHTGGHPPPFSPHPCRLQRLSGANLGQLQSR